MANDFSDIDFSGLTSQVADLQASYADMSETFGDLAEDAETRLGNIKDSIKEINLSLADTYSRLNIMNQSVLVLFTSINDGLKKMGTHTEKIAESFKKLKEFSDFRLLTPSAAPDIDKKQEAAVHEGGDSVEAANQKLLASIDSLDAKINSLDSSMKKLRDEEDKKANMMQRLLANEAKTAGSASKGLLDKITQGVTSAGGVFGGMLALMILGVTEPQRKQAEKGEMLNALEASSSVFEQATKDSTDWLARFGENAQWQLGISREEIQKYVKDLTNAGVVVDGSVIDTSKGLEDVRANIVTLTLGIDKHLNLASGSSMKNTIELMKNYGYSLDEAGAKVEKLSLAAQRSGADIQGFINGLMAGSASLVQYGIDLDDVGDTYMAIQEQYSGKLGPGKSQMVGKQSMDTTNALLNAIGNMSTEAKMVFASRYMFKDMQPEDAYQRYNSLLLEAEKNPKLMKSIIPTIQQFYKDQTRESNNPAFTLSQKKDLGNFTPVQAQTVLDMVFKGGAYGEASDDQLKALGAAFKTESTILTDLQKIQRELIAGLSKMGEGMLQMLGGILGMMISLARSLPVMIDALAIKLNPKYFFNEEKQAEASRMISNVEALTGSMASATKRGLDTFLVGSGNVFDTFFKALELNNSLDTAMNTDLRKGTTPGRSSEDVASANVDWATKMGDLENAKKFKELGDRIQQLEKEGGAANAVKATLLRLQHDLTYDKAVVQNAVKDPQAVQRQLDDIKQTLSGLAAAAKGGYTALTNIEVLSGSTFGQLGSLADDAVLK